MARGGCNFSTGKEHGIKSIVPARWSENRDEQAEETKERVEEGVRMLASKPQKSQKALKLVREASKFQCCRRTAARAPEGTKTETTNLEETVAKARPEDESQGTH